MLTLACRWRGRIRMCGSLKKPLYSRESLLLRKCADFHHSSGALSPDTIHPKLPTMKVNRKRKYTSPCLPLYHLRQCKINYGYYCATKWTTSIGSAVTGELKLCRIFIQASFPLKAGKFKKVLFNRNRNGLIGGCASHHRPQPERRARLSGAFFHCPFSTILGRCVSIYLQLWQGQMST